MPPVPADIKIIQPAADIPEEVRNFSGEFCGKWFYRRLEPSSIGEIYGRLYVNFSLYVLSIEKIERGAFRARVTYAWGTNEKLGKTGGFRKHDAIIESKDGRTSLCFDGENGKKRVFYFESGKFQGNVFMPGMVIVALDTKKIR